VGAGVEFSASYFGVGVVILLQGIEYLWQIQAQLSFLWIVAHDIGVADIGLPLIEHRAEVEKDCVVFADFVNWGVFGEDADRVGASADDPFVPVLRYCGGL
jgi:hypothetical protein